MPLFEFMCQGCEKVFEELLSNSDSSIPKCPACGNRQVIRQFSTFAAHSGAAGKSRSTPSLPMGGCGRCGDPGGPCGLG